MSLVKICGITDLETGIFAAKEGVSFIGLVFELSSHRYVTPDKAKEIAVKVRELGTIPVGVFTHHEANEIRTIAEKVGLEMVQLHGAKARAACFELPPHYVRVYVQHVKPDGTTEEEDVSGLDPKRDFLLYDGLTPGRGQGFDWQNFYPNRLFRFFLAGGLNPDNVQLAIKMKHPTAVDVSSGVENLATKKKDLNQIRLFMQRVREAI